MATFTWVPDFPIREASKPRVRRTELGDGYEQRIRFGLNTNLKSWALTFTTREITEIQAIRTFLDARGGSESFTWTPPPIFGATAGQYVVDEWETIQDSCAYGGVSATFRQVPEPAA
jgi:phage-related protein